jgi:hypothetical protein
VIPRVSYDTRSNSFVGFTLPLDDNGLPRSFSFVTDDFADLDSWFNTKERSTLLNIHVVQGLTNIQNHATSPSLLACYGTNSRYTWLHVLCRWLSIVEEFRTKGIRVIGFSTDADPKYLKCMRMAMGFFASMPNSSIESAQYAFDVHIPARWTWFFLRRRQLIVCMQDAVHLCTKMRNRFLSSTATLIFGHKKILANHLIQLIETTSKLDHGLVLTDVCPKDRQNYKACEKVSSEAVLKQLIDRVPDCEATHIFLQVRLIFLFTLNVS